MKKLILGLALLMISTVLFAQATPSNQVRVATMTSDFIVNISVGTEVYCVATDQWYTCKTATAGTSDLTDAAANFTADTKHDAVTLGTANGLSLSGQQLSLGTASTSTTGALSSTDWNTFNGKQSTSLADGKIWVGSAGGAATAQTMSGDATLANTGALTIANSAVTNAKMANMAATTIKGNKTGSAAAPSDLSASDVATMIGMKTAKVEDFEQAADSLSNHCHFTLAQTPTAGTISVQLNGVNLKPTTQYTIVATNKLRIGCSVYKYDQVSISYSY